MGQQRGVITGCKEPNTNLKVLTRKSQNIEDKYADQPATNCNNLPQPCFAAFEQQWMDITNFQKSVLCIYIMCIKMLFAVLYRAYVIELLNVGS